MGNGVGDFDKVKKHIWIYRKDNRFLQELINDREDLNNFLDAIHYLINFYNERNNEGNEQSKLDEVLQKLKNISIEQSTMSEFISDYLYTQQYHDQFVHINHGTDTEAYRNARKVALSRIKDNQEEHSHRLNQQKTFEKKQERIKHNSIFDSVDLENHDEDHHYRSNLH